MVSVLATLLSSLLVVGASGETTGDPPNRALMKGAPVLMTAAFFEGRIKKVGTLSLGADLCPKGKALKRVGKRKGCEGAHFKIEADGRVTVHDDKASVAHVCFDPKAAQVTHLFVRRPKRSTCVGFVAVEPGATYELSSVAGDATYLDLEVLSAPVKDLKHEAQVEAAKKSARKAVLDKAQAATAAWMRASFWSRSDLTLIREPLLQALAGIEEAHRRALDPDATPKQRAAARARREVAKAEFDATKKAFLDFALRYVDTLSSRTLPQEVTSKIPGLAALRALADIAAKIPVTPWSADKKTFDAKRRAFAEPEGLEAAAKKALAAADAGAAAAIDTWARLQGAMPVFAWKLSLPVVSNSKTALVVLRPGALTDKSKRPAWVGRRVSLLGIGLEGAAELGSTSKDSPASDRAIDGRLASVIGALLPGLSALATLEETAHFFDAAKATGTIANISDPPFASLDPLPAAGTPMTPPALCTLLGGATEGKLPRVVVLGCPRWAGDRRKARAEYAKAGQLAALKPKFGTKLEVVGPLEKNKEYDFGVCKGSGECKPEKAGDKLLARARISTKTLSSWGLVTEVSWGHAIDSDLPLDGYEFKPVGIPGPDQIFELRGRGGADAMTISELFVLYPSVLCGCEHLRWVGVGLGTAIVKNGETELFKQADFRVVFRSPKVPGVVVTAGASYRRVQEPRDLAVGSRVAVTPMGDSPAVAPPFATRSRAVWSTQVGLGLDVEILEAAAKAITGTEEDG